MLFPVQMTYFVCHRATPPHAQGRTWHDEIGKRLVKLQEPPPMKKHKALPAPIDKVKKRRGGKRFRKFKEQFEVTELARQANRMEFNVAQVCTTNLCVAPTMARISANQ